MKRASIYQRQNSGLVVDRRHGINAGSAGEGGVRQNLPTQSGEFSREKLQYVVRMLHELRVMAEGIDDGTLSYLVEMAYIHGEEELLRRELKKG